MEVAKKAATRRKRVKTVVAAKDKAPVVRDIISNVGQWGAQQKINIINAGISKSELEVFKKHTALDYETLSRMLGVTKATLHNKKGNEKFNPQISDRALVLAEIYAYGEEVFGEKERFGSWLVGNIRALGGGRPIDYLDTLHGMIEIKQLIGRIAYGVYS